MYSGVIGLSRVSKLVSCFVLRFVYESFLFCVGIPKVTNTSQFIEILKVWTASCCFELKQAVGKWLKDGSNKPVWFTCLAVKGKFKACSKNSPQRFN